MKMDRIGENQGVTHRPKTPARKSSKEHSVKDTVDIGSSRHVPDRKQIMKALSAAEIGEVLSLSIDAMPLWDCKDPSLQSTKFPSLIASKDGALFARSGDGLLRLDGETGKVEWQSALSTPLVLQHDSTWQGKDGKLLVFCQDQTIRSLDPATGKEEWSFPLGADFKAPLSVEDDGTMLVFRKKGDNLHLTRLRPDGSIVKSTRLGLWDDPIGGNPVQGHFLSTEPDGDRIIKATTREAPQPNGYRPTHFSTIRVGADGTVKWSKDHTVEPPVFFPGDPDHFYTLEFGSMQRLSRATGESLWTLKNKPEHEGGIGGQGYGDMLFELGGEKKYKYLKLVDATPDRLILQGYCEGPLRSTKSGEEILCVDAANPEKVLWKRDSGGSIFGGPLYVDDKAIVHQKEQGPVEALDPSTGTPLWESTVPGQGPGGGIQIFEKDSRERQSHRTAEGNILLRSKDTICMLDGTEGYLRNTFYTGSPDNIMSLDAQDDTLYTYAADETDRSPMIRAFGISEAFLMEQAKKRIESAARAGAAGKETLELEDDRITIDGVSIERQKAHE